MASYGSFETDREVASGHGSVIYSAHKAGETGSSYAVKTFSLERDIGADQESHEALAPLLEGLARSFTEHVTLQKTAAESSKNLAPIFEFGNDGESAWYVTRLYPRTVRKVIEGRVALSYEAFYHVIRSVVAGVQDLKRICGRPHGNLKPTNVLIGGGARIREAEVVISDPLPGSEADSGRYELADLRAIGQIIYQLVRKRELTDESNWLILPIETSAEWTNLFGKNTPAWLTLCNRLLDPGLSLENYDLTKLEADLAPLQPKPPVSRGMLVIAGAAVVALAVGLFFLLNRPTRMMVESNPAPAVILENGREVARTLPGKPAKLPNFPPGEHTLTAHYEGLDDVATNFTLAKGETRTVRFNFEFGTARLESQPSGASVRVEGQELGKTPLTLHQKPSSKTYEFNLGENFETAKVPVTIKLNETTNLSVVLKQLSTGGTEAIVTFNSDPDGAILFINGANIGEMTTRRSVASGVTNRIEARFRDWPPVTTNLVLTPGPQPDVNISFDYGTVRLQSDPPGAFVHVGTNQFGPTPVTMISATGPVVFQFGRPGYDGTNVTYTVVKGSTITPEPVKLASTNAILEITGDPLPQVITVKGARSQQVYTNSRNPLVISSLAPGDFTISAHFGDLDDQTLTKSAPKGVPTPFAFNLDYGTAQLASDPPDATIMSGANRVGTAPQKFIQKPGKPYSYTFTTPDYERYETNVTVDAKASGNVLAKLVRNKVNVALNSDPPSAVLIDGSDNLGAVEQNQKLRWGDHRLTATYPGLDPVSTNLAVARSGDTRFTFQFNYGTVAITSAPPGAVIIDAAGQRIGLTPTNLHLKPGPAHYLLVYNSKTNDLNAVTVQRGFTNWQGASLGPPEIISSIGMELVWVDKLPAATAGGKDGGYAGKYEVTQAEYEKVMKANPSQFKGDPHRPVESVSWSEAMEFCQKLNDVDKGVAPAGMHYGLPSEAQWRFFAEGALPKDGIVKRSDTEGTAPVGSTGVPNKYGLFDIIGNVWEWCDGAGDDKPMRGCAFNSIGGLATPLNIEASSRVNLVLKRPDVGFRVVLTP